MCKAKSKWNRKWRMKITKMKMNLREIAKLKAKERHEVVWKEKERSGASGWGGAWTREMRDTTKPFPFPIPMIPFPFPFPFPFAMPIRSRCQQEEAKIVTQEAKMC